MSAAVYVDRTVTRCDVQPFIKRMAAVGVTCVRQSPVNPDKIRVTLRVPDSIGFGLKAASISSK